MNCRDLERNLLLYAYEELPAEDLAACEALGRQVAQAVKED